MVPLLIALGVGAAASIAGSVISSNAAGKAAGVQAATARENRGLAEDYTGRSLGDLDTALGGAMENFDKGLAESKGYLSPYATTGNEALSRLADIYGLNGEEAAKRGLSGFTTSPGYEFRLSQGVQALQRGANATNGVYSGAADKALVDYGQNVGSAEYGDWYNRYVTGLTGLVNGGQSAAGNLSGLSSNIYGSKANALLGTGQAKAAARSSGLSAITGANAQAGAAQAGGMINQANAWNAGLQNLTQLAGFGASQWPKG